MYEDAATFTPEAVQLYLAPIVASDDRITQFQQLCDWKKDRPQLMEIAPTLKASKIPAQIIWGDADVMVVAQGSLGYGLTSIMGAIVAEIFQGRHFNLF